MDSVTTVVRFRQGPPEGDITSVTVSIVLDVFSGYIVKNGSGWWCTWIWGETCGTKCEIPLYMHSSPLFSLNS